MKKALGWPGLALLLAASPAHAEDYVFPTDILGRGTLDFAFIVRHDANTTGLRTRTNHGQQTLDLVNESLQLRYGLGGHAYLGALFSWNSHHSLVTDYFHPRIHRTNNANSGQQNPDFWLSYGLIDKPENPFALTLELRLSPNTTGDPSAYGGKLSAGWTSSEKLRFFAALGATTHPDSSIPGASSLSAGIYRKVSENLTLTLQSSRTIHAASDNWTAWQQHNLGLSANIRLSSRLYLVPNIVFYRNDGSASRTSSLRREATNDGRMESLAVHYQF